VKRSLLTAALLFVSAAPAQAADGVSLAASSSLVRFQGHVTLAGTVAPAIPGEPVTIMQGSKQVWSGATAIDGSFGTTVFEVRDGRVVGISHVSTGVTGNTPIGTWHVVRLPMWFAPGFHSRWQHGAAVRIFP
jgi:hypothetical protein